MDLAAVYSRTLEERNLHLAPSGWTYRQTFVLYDQETGSLWYPYAKGLRAISGPLFNQWLPQLSSQDISWWSWRKKHPNSKVLR